MAASEHTGKVYLVGAGPGDPGLLTVRGAELLARADAVLYDYLVNAALLAHAREGAEKICLGRHGHGRIMSQAEVNERMIELAREGRQVVRLKSGDPAIFGRLFEEAGALHAAGIPLEIVPGITAAAGAGAFAGVPLTHRDHASAVAFITGQQGPNKDESGLDYDALARFPGTLVFYMGVTTVQDWTGELLAAGKPAETPVAIVRRCSFPDQQTIECRLDQVIDRLMPSSKLRPPVVVIIGPVAAQREALRWFESRPLFGQTVLVTRPAHQAEDLRGPLAEQGAEVLLQPAIDIGPPDDWSPVDEAIARLPEFDWIVFSSSNGVRAFLGRLEEAGRDLRALGGVKLAAIGPGTARELAAFRLRADLLPEEFRAESMAEALREHAAGGSFLLIRASRGREILAEEVAAAGGDVTQVVAYESTDVTQPDEEIAARMRAGEIDWVTVTSSAIARSLVGLFGDDLRETRLASISPITSGTLRELGFEPVAEAKQYTMPGVVEAILVARA